MCFVDSVIQLHIFIQLQQDIEAKYPDFLTSVISKIIPSMTQLAPDDGSHQRLFANLIRLCQWNIEQDAHQSSWYSSLISLL